MTPEQAEVLVAHMTRDAALNLAADILRSLADREENKDVLMEETLRSYAVDAWLLTEEGRGESVPDDVYAIAPVCERCNALCEWWGQVRDKLYFRCPKCQATYDANGGVPERAQAEANAERLHPMSDVVQKLAAEQGVPVVDAPVSELEPQDLRGMPDLLAAQAEIEAAQEKAMEQARQGIFVLFDEGFDDEAHAIQMLLGIVQEVDDA